MRRYRVVIDGTEVGRIRNGATEVFAVAPGRHTVMLRIDWLWASPSIEVEVRPGETAKLECWLAVRSMLGPIELVKSYFKRDRWIALELVSDPSAPQASPPR